MPSFNNIERNHLLVALIIVLVAIASFYGGMQYQKRLLLSGYGMNQRGMMSKRGFVRKPGRRPNFAPVPNASGSANFRYYNQ